MKFKIEDGWQMGHHPHGHQDVETRTSGICNMLEYRQWHDRDGQGGKVRTVMMLQPLLLWWFNGKVWDSDCSTLTFWCWFHAEKMSSNFQKSKFGGALEVPIRPCTRLSLSHNSTVRFHCSQELNLIPLYETPIWSPHKKSSPTKPYGGMFNMNRRSKKTNQEADDLTRFIVHACNFHRRQGKVEPPIHRSEHWWDRRWKLMRLLMWSTSCGCYPACMV